MAPWLIPRRLGTAGCQSLPPDKSVEGRDAGHEEIVQRTGLGAGRKAGSFKKELFRRRSLRDDLLRSLEPRFQPAARAIGWRRGEEIVPAWLPLFQHPHEEVRSDGLFAET